VATATVVVMVGAITAVAVIIMDGAEVIIMVGGIIIVGDDQLPLVEEAACLAAFFIRSDIPDYPANSGFPTSTGMGVTPSTR
jgi:hypothetical protein